MTGVSVALLLASLAQRAQAGDGVVALQTADPSCPDDSGNIYVDCGNGTVTDNRTGLVWLQNADCYGVLDWHQAVELVANLSDIPAGSAAAGSDCGLSDGSSPGEWRLPSQAEWEAMIADAVALGCVSGSFGDPSITNDSGAGCYALGPSSFYDVVSSGYWSATTDVFFPTVAWRLNLLTGTVNFLSSKTITFYLWPVRDG